MVLYLQDNGFKTYIVSGGGVEFMRPWTEAAYNIPPERVIGSSIVTEFKMQDGKPVLVRQPKVFFLDDKEGKAIAIQKFIGGLPIASFGNADHDIPMIQWTLAGDRCCHRWGGGGSHRRALGRHQEARGSVVLTSTCTTVTCPFGIGPKC